MKAMTSVGWMFATVLVGACGGDDPEPCPESGTACVWAGTGERGFNQDVASRLDSKFYFPSDLTFDADGRAYIADYNNHRIRRVEADQKIVSIVGTDYEGDGAPGDIDRLPLGAPEGTDGSNVAMNHPTDVKIGPNGKVYIGAWHNNKIRVYEPDTGRTSTLSGGDYGFKGDGGPCYFALWNQPKSLAIAPDGTIYANDQRNLRIRRITPDDIITTIAGSGVKGNTGDGGSALEASWGFDIGTTPQPSGGILLVENTLYVADSDNNRIRKIDLSTGVVSAVAGDPAGVAGYADGVGAEVRFDYPGDMELGPDGLIYIADRKNNAIRTLDPATGTVATIAGTATPCPSATACFGEDGLPARETQLNEPYGIAFDAAWNLYIADSHNHRFLKVTR